MKELLVANTPLAFMAWLVIGFAIGLAVRWAYKSVDEE